MGPRLLYDGLIGSRIRAFDWYQNQRPFDDLERRIQGLPKVFKYPLLSQERVKLLISNLASTFRSRVHPNKSPLKGAWAYPGTAQSF